MIKKILFFSSFICSSLIADIDVVSSQKNELGVVSKNELSKVYLKKSDSINGKKVVPMNVEEDYDEFNKKVLNKNPKQIHAYWMKQIFTGTKIPPKKIKRKEVKDKLENNKDSIAYTSQKHELKVIHEAK
jgi:hypothetical protein